MHQVFGNGQLGPEPGVDEEKARVIIIELGLADKVDVFFGDIHVLTIDGITAQRGDTAVHPPEFELLVLEIGQHEGLMVASEKSTLLGLAELQQAVYDASGVRSPVDVVADEDEMIVLSGRQELQ